LNRTSSKYIPEEQQQQGRLVSRTLATGIGGGGYSALPPPTGSSQYSALPPSAGRQSSKYSAFPPAGADSNSAAGGSNPPREKRGANAEEEDSESINEEISFVILFKIL
jgi:hypothetical protein